LSILHAQGAALPQPFERIDTDSRQSALRACALFVPDHQTGQISKYSNLQENSKKTLLENLARQEFIFTLSCGGAFVELPTIHFHEP
jgi:hypothetical protein